MIDPVEQSVARIAPYTHLLRVRLMKNLRSEKPLPERNGRFRVVQLTGQWYVVGPGCLCVVNDYAEGVQLIEQLRAEGERHHASVRQPQGGTHTT